MPGREDLIQQNIDRARVAVETADQQEKTSGENPTTPIHRSLLGANLDVASALDKIEFAFEGPLGDGSMRNSVAYIRRWKRGGTKSTTEGSTQTINPGDIDPGSDPQTELERVITDLYGPERENAVSIEYTDDFTAARVTNSDGSVTYISTEVLDTPDGRVIQTNVDGSILVRGEDGEFYEGESRTYTTKYREVNSADTTLQQNRQNSLIKEIPVVKYNPNNPTVQEQQDPTTQENTTEPSTDPYVGPLKPANPNGFVNILSRIGRRVLGLPPGQIGYSGVTEQGPKGTGSVGGGGVLIEGVWQFLFNPSELEIEAGPEFKVAETWGVSDKANSGQPLNWSHNKNAQLKFNSVLLNGYIFGRKVEQLEQGIFELFMARDGEGQDGPPILEFVWGKRVFGPCVIKDISIKEKMWDEGMVVNAELSFVLEQIPEWTINDGFVDVARPGKVPLVYDPVVNDQTGSPTTTPGATDTPAAPPSGTPDQKSQNPQQPQADFIACQELQRLKLNGVAFNPFPGNYYSQPVLDYLGSYIGTSPAGQGRIYRSNFNQNYLKYNSLVAKGNSLGVTTSTKCAPTTIKAEHDRLTKNANDSLKEVADKRMASVMNDCANELGNKAGTFFKQKGCERFLDKNNPNKPI